MVKWSKIGGKYEKLRETESIFAKLYKNRANCLKELETEAKFAKISQV